MKILDLSEDSGPASSWRRSLLLLRMLHGLPSRRFSGTLLMRLSKGDVRNRSFVHHALLIWIGTFLLNSGAGAVRRMLDPRIFLKMFIEIATDVARSGKEKGHSVSKQRRARTFTRVHYICRVQNPGHHRTIHFNRRSSLRALIFRLENCPCVSFHRSSSSRDLPRLYQEGVTLQKDLHDNREEAYEYFQRKTPKKFVRITRRSLALNSALLTGERLISER